ncbi:52 kDa repressor of the inhibitor of the protein kinase-like [Stylophora pistillata]|uniref:52 kDa repressor of the inhibitor of the protein kinase-like n=1 Tax=Stylophora pistillata TaxID=50429 RepID=UPI000C05182E|nr:52 kDa repressor of the inhibitor of the protein kinase-like [Stylophora pistillata]
MINRGPLTKRLEQLEHVVNESVEVEPACKRVKPNNDVQDGDTTSEIFDKTPTPTTASVFFMTPNLDCHTIEEWNYSENMFVEAIDDFAGLLTAEKKKSIRPRIVSAIKQGPYAIRKISFPKDLNVWQEQVVSNLLAERIYVASVPSFQGREPLSKRGDEFIAKHLRECARNATYTSATIQHDIIEITMEYLRNQIINEIPEYAPFFTIFANETTDVWNTEQLCISIRFVDETCSIHEEFLGFVSLARTTGEAVAISFLETLQTWSLDMKNCGGQGYDGACSMSSAARRTQAFIRQTSSKTVYTHCNAHCLNLAIVHFCDIVMIRNMIRTLNEICYFIKFSPKRHELLAVVINIICPNTRRTTLTSPCHTCWVKRHEACEVFDSLFRAIVKTLEVMANERVYLDEYGSWRWDQETCTKAKGFLAVVTQFQFIVTMNTVMKCLSLLKSLSMQL